MRNNLHMDDMTTGDIHMVFGWMDELCKSNGFG
jgi:hypothetical protein